MFCQLPRSPQTVILKAAVAGIATRQSISRAPPAYPGKILRSDTAGRPPPGFVLAGLVPATHAFERPNQRRGCADQVRATRLGVFPGAAQWARQTHQQNAIDRVKFREAPIANGRERKSREESLCGFYRTKRQCLSNPNSGKGI